MNELVETIDIGKPSSEHSIQLETLYALVRERLQGNTPAQELKAIARQLADVASGWRAQLDRFDTASAGESWPLWYLGQVECLLGLVRSALVDRLPAAAEAVLRRKQVPTLLRLLKAGERTLSELAEQANMDLSYVDREIGHMARAQLVSTSKEQRKRWVGLTSMGSAALERIQVERQAASKARVERALEVTLSSVSKLVERQQRVEDRLAALTNQLAGQHKATTPAFGYTVMEEMDPFFPIDKVAASQPLQPPARTKNSGFGFIEITPEEEEVYRVLDQKNSVRGFLKVTDEGGIQFFKGDRLVKPETKAKG